MVFGIVEHIGVIPGVVARIRGTRTPDHIAAVQEIAPGTILGRGIVVEHIAVVGIEPSLAELVLDVRDAEDAARLEGTVIGHLHGFVLFAALGGDDDGAIAGAGTVEGRGGSALEDGDGLNVLGVDVGGLVTKVNGIVQALVAHGAVGHRNSVHHIERGVAREGGIAADNDLLGSSGAAGGGNLHARHLAGKAGHGVGSVSFEDFLGTDRGGRIAEGLFLAGHAGRGDDHFVQADGVFFHLDVDPGPVTYGLGDVTHSEEGKLDGVSSPDVQGIGSLRIRHCAYIGAFHEDRDARHRITARVRNNAGYCPVLRVKGGRRDSQKARHEQFYFFHKHEKFS